MPNENSLEGMQCPQCGSEEPFRIAVHVIMLMYDHGSHDDKMSSEEWGPDDYCECWECSHAGTVHDFQIAGAEAHFLRAEEEIHIHTEEPTS
jgi:hypothetical protein